MTDEITDREFTAMLIGSRENVLPIELMIHVNENGGTLTQEQQEKVERLNHCATTAMEGLISSLEAVGELVSHIPDHTPSGRLSGNTAWLIAIISDLLNGAHLLESDTRDILHRSELSAAESAGNTSELDRSEGLEVATQ